MSRRTPLPWLCIAAAVCMAPLEAQAGTETPAGAAAVSGQSAPILEDDPAPLLGYGIAEAITRFGPPGSVRPFRGEEAWQDDVAFIYPPGYTLFWSGDRLWQIRFTAPYTGTIYGLFIGDQSSKVYSTLGQPYEIQGETLIYRLAYRGYPVRLSLVFASDRLADVYLYRADY
ncbi:MAG TPA: hypothetical protein VFL04_01185 [Rectinemataceae bacterium]|nr:hypothetical protein [Rectinemataceae bacterium]